MYIYISSLEQSIPNNPIFKEYCDFIKRCLYLIDIMQTSDLIKRCYFFKNTNDNLIYYPVVCSRGYLEDRRFYIELPKKEFNELKEEEKDENKFREEWNNKKQLLKECWINVRKLNLDFDHFILNKYLYFKLNFIKERMFTILEYLKKKLITKSIYDNKKIKMKFYSFSLYHDIHKNYTNSLVRQEEYEIKKREIRSYIKDLPVLNKYYLVLLELYKEYKKKIKEEKRFRLCNNTLINTINEEQINIEFFLERLKQFMEINGISLYH